MKKKSLQFLMTILAIAFPFAAAGETISWDSAIDSVRKKADFYWDFGARNGAFTSLGTAVNELDIPRHECAIVGRMLKVTSEIAHLEKLEQPEVTDEMTADEIQRLMYISLSLSNWAFTAERILRLTEADRRQIWNLNCVGNHGISSSAFLEIAQSRAQFRQDGADLFVLGDIESNFAGELELWLESYPETERVVLGSGGGNVREAILSGLVIRKKGIDTAISQNCYSACPLVFLGGVTRTIWSPYPLLGFHQASINGNAVPRDSEIYSYISEYAALMGVDSSFLLQSMLRANPNEIFEPDLDSLCLSKIATWIQRICGQ